MYQSGLLPLSAENKYNKSFKTIAKLKYRYFQGIILITNIFLSDSADPRSDYIFFTV